MSYLDVHAIINEVSLMSDMEKKEFVDMVTDRYLTADDAAAIVKNHGCGDKIKETPEGDVFWESYWEILERFGTKEIKNYLRELVYDR